MTAGTAPKVLECDEDIESIAYYSKNNLYTECAYKIQACGISTKESLRTFVAMPAVMRSSL
jgi:hypothetical protein